MTNSKFLLGIMVLAGAIGGACSDNGAGTPGSGGSAGGSHGGAGAGGNPGVGGRSGLAGATGGQLGSAGTVANGGTTGAETGAAGATGLGGTTSGGSIGSGGSLIAGSAAGGTTTGATTAAPGGTTASTTATGGAKGGTTGSTSGAAGGTTATLGGTTATGGAKGGTTGSSGGAAGGTTANTGGATATGGAKGGTSGSSGGAMGGTTGSTGGATGGAGGQSTVGSCNVEPVTPNATPQTRKVLCYLYQIYGNHILSAQEENNDDIQLNYIFQTTGKKPAIRSFDMNNSKAPGQCVDHWNNGGLCMFGYHMGIAGSYSTKTDIEQVLTEGSSYNTTFKSRLDTYAGAFQQLAAVNGVGIVRLLHEAGKNCAWFWWGMGTADQYVRLYKYAFNYLTVTKGLKNTIWMVPLCGSGVDSAYNPGKGFADLGGSDTYAGAGNYGPLTDQFNKTVAAFPGLPIALHENGPIPDPDQMKAAGAKWLMFNTWCDQFPEPPSNSVDHLKAVYTHEYVITLDEMPNLK